MTNKYGERMCDTEMKTKQKTWEAMSAEERKFRIAIVIFDRKHLCDVPDYPTSLPAAFEVVEKMREAGFAVCISRGFLARWRAAFTGPGVHDKIFSVTDESLPAAICLAALRAMSDWQPLPPPPAVSEPNLAP